MVHLSEIQKKSFHLNLSKPVFGIGYLATHNIETHRYYSKDMKRYHNLHHIERNSRRCVDCSVHDRIQNALVLDSM